MFNKLSLWKRLFPIFVKSRKKIKFYTNISYKYHIQTTNTLVIYNIGNCSLKDIKVIITGSEQNGLEYKIDDLLYRGSIEVPINQLNNNAIDIKASLFVRDHWEKYVLKQNGSISRLK
jgi:hypothetical protein